MTDHDNPVVGTEDPVDEVDLANLAAVRELYEQLDPMPTDLAARVKFALALEQMDAEVAKLVESSFIPIDARGPVAEATEQARTIIFESSALTVMVTVSPLSRELVRVDGWLSPEGEYRVELRTPDAQHRTDSDAEGRFVVAELPRGLFRMVIRPPRGTGRHGNNPVVITPSVVLD